MTAPAPAAGLRPTAARPRRALTPVCAGLALAAAASTWARAGEVEPDARRLLDEVARAYKALPAYADRGEFTLTVERDGQSHTVRQPASVALVRPNKLKVDAGAASLVCDGSNLTTLVGPSRKYAPEPAPKALAFHHVAEGPVGSLMFGGPSGPPMLMVLGLLLAEDPARAVLDQGESLRLAPDAPLDGRSCRVLSLRSAGGTEYRLFVDPASKLVRAVEAVPDASAVASLFPAGAKVRVPEYRWAAGRIASEVPGSAFAAEMPRDFAKLGEAPRAAKGDDEPDFQVETLIGKPAPKFTLTLLDGPGKTRTVSLADFAGKVVMIDFWATWCGPCLVELPEVQKLIEGYAKAGKDVVVVALSQDNDPKELDAVRKLVETTLKEKKLDLAVAPVGKVALDPSNSVGDAFKVEGYPTVVLIDAKGVVRAAHAGYSPRIGKTLGRQIDALLEGKPVPKEDDK